MADEHHPPRKHLQQDKLCGVGEALAIDDFLTAIVTRLQEFCSS